MTTTIRANQALLADAWQQDVVVHIDDNGLIASLSRAQEAIDVDEQVDILVPAIANVHSHAHQRAMAGLGEKAGFSEQDSFWNWRQVMYHYLERIQPGHLHAIASQLYLEMLRAGYSCVGEFQYLHHDTNGKRYDNPAEMTLQCQQAASDLGIGFTALPVLYRYGGFGDTEPQPAQMRFINDADQFCRIVEALDKSIVDDNSALGIAPHSLRAINSELLNDVIQSLKHSNLVHIHIAEQQKEVDDCLAWCGQRPVEWLLDHFDVNQSWCLIHATHMNQAETSAVARSQAVVGLCPTTEANLGDGIFNIVDFAASNGRWAIGSDSHISISPVEELRWLEYGQRLQSQQRNRMASSQHPHTGRELINQALAGGAQACARHSGKIEVGYRADLLVLDAQHPRLYARQENDIINSWIFSGNENPVRDVYVNGDKVIANGHHAMEEKVTEEFCKVLDQLAN